MKRIDLTEKEWQELVVGFARLHGWWCYHTFDSRKSEAGLPDLILMRPPELIIAELKSERGKVSSDQSQVLDSLRACGVEAPLWRPSDEAQMFARLSGKPKVLAIAEGTPERALHALPDGAA